MKKYFITSIIFAVIISCAGLAFVSGCKKREFETQYYSVIYSVEESGRIEGVAEQRIEYGGSASTVTAVANAGYKFVEWSDGIKTAERTDKDIKSDKTVTALFEKQNYTITYETDGNGVIEGTAAQTVAYNESATQVTAIPNTGYKFVKWSDEIKTAERIDKNITTDKTVTALFEKQNYTITYETDGNGNIEGKATQTVDYNESATKVTAIPNIGYQFAKWSDEIETAERTDENVTSDKTVKAIFDKLTYNVIYQTDGNGYIVGNASQIVEYGDNAAKVTPIPNIGYKFVKWSDGVTNDVRQDLNVIGNIEVIAEFEC